MDSQKTWYCIKI